MPVDPEKEKLLVEKGFAYVPDALCFVNRGMRKAFTRMYVDDHDLDSLLSEILSRHESPTWKIFYSPQQRHTLDDIYRVLGQPLPSDF